MLASERARVIRCLASVECLLTHTLFSHFDSMSLHAQNMTPFTCARWDLEMLETFVRELLRTPWSVERTPCVNVVLRLHLKGFETGTLLSCCRRNKPLSRFYTLSF